MLHGRNYQSITASGLLLLSCLGVSTTVLFAQGIEHTAAQLTQNAASRIASGSTDIKDVIVDAANIAAKKGIEATKTKAAEEGIHDWMMRTDISIEFKKDDDPNIVIETIQPIYQNELNTVFWQGRVASRNGDQTVNLGVGYRHLLPSKEWMLGTNAFVDKTSKNDHQRWGLGLEAFSPYTTLRYNHYKASSGDQVISNNAGLKTIELAQSGWDLGLETPVPYVDWARLNFKHYQWDGVYQDDTEGNSLSVRMYPSNNIEIEIGAQNDNTDDTRSFANLTWYFDKPAHAPKHSQARRAVAKRDVNDLRLEKVRRHNDIVVETRTVGSIGITIGRGT